MAVITAAQNNTITTHIKTQFIIAASLRDAFLGNNR